MENLNFGLGVTLAVIITLGIAGNVSSFVTWTRGRNCKNLPGTIFLRVLALSDTAVLCGSGVQFAWLLMFQQDLRNLHDVPCKFYDAVGHFFALISTWLVVSVCVHRTIAVYAPLRSARRRTRKHNEIVVIVVLSILFFCLSLPYGMSFHLVEVDDATPTQETIPPYALNTTVDVSVDISPTDLIKITLPGPETLSLTTTEKRQIKHVCQGDPEAFLQKWHEWIIDVALLFVIPFSFLFVCNAILLAKLFRRYDDLLTESQMNKDRHDGTFASMTARVVAISIAHLVLVGPTAITGLIPGFPHSAYIMTHVLYFTNHGVNFIFYSVFGTSFRKDWLALCYKTYRRIPGQNSGL